MGRQDSASLTGVVFVSFQLKIYPWPAKILFFVCQSCSLPEITHLLPSAFPRYVGSYFIASRISLCYYQATLVHSQREGGHNG